MTITNDIIHGSQNREITIDSNLPLPKEDKKHVILFSHGFKGFKDWGCFNQISSWFSTKGYTFIKYNFSHNGTTSDSPLDFVDLEAFGQNRLSYELSDLHTMIRWVRLKYSVEKYRLTIIGHSRGGGITLASALHPEVDYVIGWAPVSDFKRWVDMHHSAKVQIWQREGVLYIENARTKQSMPLYYSFYEDVKVNADLLDIRSVLSRTQKPILIIHGTEDEALPVQGSRTLSELSSYITYVELEGEGHTFHATHPPAPELPDGIQQLLSHSLSFLEVSHPL